MNIIYWILWVIVLSIWSLLIGGIDRKIVARLQGRYGPPFWQDITDFIKLFHKRGKIASRSATQITDLALLIGAISIVLGLSVLPVPTSGGYFQLISTSGDLIILAYVFALIALTYVLIGFSGKSPYTLVGSSR
jgi:NADH-quinone oxidoreductase subunit H